MQYAPWAPIDQQVRDFFAPYEAGIAERLPASEFVAGLSYSTNRNGFFGNIYTIDRDVTVSSRYMIEVMNGSIAQFRMVGREEFVVSARHAARAEQLGLASSALDYMRTIEAARVQMALERPMGEEQVQELHDMVSTRSSPTTVAVRNTATEGIRSLNHAIKQVQAAADRFAETLRHIVPAMEIAAVAMIASGVPQSEIEQFFDRTEGELAAILNDNDMVTKTAEVEVEIKSEEIAERLREEAQAMEDAEYEARYAEREV